jgi:hypothetical protein
MYELRTIKGDTLGELVKCKILKIYSTIKNSCQVRHIQPRSQIPETLTEYVRPPDQTYPTSQPFPELTNHMRLPSRIPEASCLT